MRKMLIIFASFLIIYSSGTLEGEESESAIIDDALNYILHGEYRTAAYKLEMHLYPLTLKSDKEILRAKFLLGECYFFLREEEKAEKEFLSLLKLKNDFQPDPLYTPIQVIEFFERVKKNHKRELERYFELKKELTRLPHGEVKEPVRASSLSYLLDIAPPSGQFNNRQYLKGVEIGLLLIVSGIANLYSYKWLKDYQENGYPEDERATAGGMRTINYISFGLLLSTYIYGASDALYYHLKIR